MLFRVFAIILALSLSACSSWVYRIDIPQGNYLEQKDIDKLQIAMTKEQVKFILGSPVVVDTFNKDTWYYVYDMKRGMSKRGDDIRKELILTFVDGKLSTMKGDFKKPEEFDIPLEV